VSQTGSERIPFWRNVKVIGILAQIVFIAVLLAGIGFLINNTVTALARANLPANFSFMPARAGIPIAETPIPYTTNDPYWRALVIGLLNTLKVALVGVVLASLLGVGVGVMRLSSNLLVRTVATVYIELLRNIPLAVQIVFWYSAILLPFPPRVSNPIELPGGVFLANQGIAIPFLYPGYAFASWWPFVAAAVVAAVVAWVVRRRQAERSERPLSVWPIPLAILLLLPIGAYLTLGMPRAAPAQAAVDFNVDRARGTTFLDLDGNGRRGPNEPTLPFANLMIRLAEAELSVATQNIAESRREVGSTFRFPRLNADEFTTAEVTFADPDAAAAAGYRIHFDRFPNIGRIYVDLNDNGTFDAGEEFNPLTGVGYNEVDMVLTLTGFQRRLVSDRDGLFRTSPFKPVGTAAAAEAAAEPVQESRGVGVFGTPAAPAPAATVLQPLRPEVELLPAGALVLSPVQLPVAGFEGGQRFTVNYLALLFALVIYTSAFIGEIVRGGIQAVAKGQREAAQALGLSAGQTFSLVIFPQALRIVLPPMISQYLNLTKNSSLAPLAAYGELFVIATITANQTGASIPVALMLVVAYLIISLTFALVLNVVNDRIALVER
jgi:His/Glu/Gln/Arg/opine family amino acid ABC transporter permease subunit